MTKRDVKWAFTIVVLVILLVFSYILGTSGYYFSISHLNSNTDMTIGEAVTVGVVPNQSNVFSITFDGSFLPGEKIPQTVSFVSLDLDTDVSLRAKAEIFGAGEDNLLDFVLGERFQKNSDGYYYLTDVLQGGAKATFCTSVIVPAESKFSSDDKYILTFVVESLKSDLDESLIWETLP